MNTVIELKCSDQFLSPITMPYVTSGGINETSIKTIFSKEWDGLAIKCSFKGNNGTTYYADVSNGECIIPSQISAQTGAVYVGYYGIGLGITKTSSLIRFDILQGTTVPTIEVTICGDNLLCGDSVIIKE